MSEPFEDYGDFDDDTECANCGGEGFYYSCEEEFACLDPEGGCDLCRRRCNWCQPRKVKEGKWQLTKN